MRDPLINVQTQLRPPPPTRLRVNWQALAFWGVYLIAVATIAADVWVWRP